MGLDPIIKEFRNFLYNNYNSFKVGKISKRRFKYEEYFDCINILRASVHFSFEKIGDSEEGRALSLIKIGHGETKLFLWSQMHGDEPTASLAILDILNFFGASDEVNGVREFLLNNLSIYIYPVVNPDGALKYQRENINGVDLNRDAVNLDTNEAKVLMTTFKNIQPHFAFNLHDQNSRYSLGGNNLQAAIALLAPPYDESGSVNSNRSDAMKLIGGIKELLDDYIPGHVGKYSDEYEPNAFGDTFQGLGSSTILLESGGWAGDVEKQYLRKLNFVILLSSFLMISKKSYERIALSVYDDLPMNERNLFDLIVKNVSTDNGALHEQISVGINTYEIPVEGEDTFTITTKVQGIGALIGFTGLTEFDADGCSMCILPNNLVCKSIVEKIIGEVILKREDINVIQNNAQKLFQVSNNGALQFCDKTEVELNVLIEDGFQTENIILMQDNIPQKIIANGVLFPIHASKV